MRTDPLGEVLIDDALIGIDGVIHNGTGSRVVPIRGSLVTLTSIVTNITTPSMAAYVYLSYDRVVWIHGTSFVMSAMGYTTNVLGPLDFTFVKMHINTSGSLGQYVLSSHYVTFSHP